MKKQIFAVAAAISMSASVFAADQRFDTKAEATQIVVSGLDATVGMGIAHSVIDNAGKGANCVSQSRDGQDDMALFMRRDQKTLSCVIQTAEGTAFILVNYADKAVTRVMVLGGHGLHNVALDGKAIKKAGKDNLKKSGEWIRRNLGVLSWPLGLAPAAVGSAEYVTGLSVQVLGEAGYVVLTEGAQRIDVIVENAEGLVTNATMTAVETATFEPGNAANNFVGVLAGVMNIPFAVITGHNDAKLNSYIKGTKYSITLN